MAIEDYSRRFIVNVTELLTGSSSVVQFPDVPCTLALFRAPSINVASFFVGGAVDKCFIEIDASQEAGPMELNNLNQLWYYSQSGTMDYLSYWVQR